MNFTAFRPGAGGKEDTGETLQNAAIAGEFAYSQFSEALQRARNEIFARCGQKTNSEYAEWRSAQLTEAELWIATARLYPLYGERLAVKFPESNLSGLSELQIGADTPSPVEKGVHWVEFMTAKIRGFGLELMLGQGSNWGIEIGELPASDPYPCLAPGSYSYTCSGNCGSCQCGGVL